MRYYRYTLDDLKESSDRKLFSYISFFAGGGGSSAGYKLAGGDCKFVNEFQQVAVDTYLANWPDTPHICGDIKDVTGQQIMEMTGLKKYELDIMDGSPPCPPFSMSGTKKAGWGKEKVAYGMKQKNIEDLTWEMIRIAGEMMPKVIICENVKGLTMEYAKQHLDRMVTDFEALGYSTTFKVLNGIHFGVPQKRQRVFIVSVRNDVLEDIGMPWMLVSSLFPEPALDEEPTIEQAIGDLQLNNMNRIDAEELCERMKKSAKYKWLKRLPKNPDRVVSVGDDVVSNFYEKFIAHRKKWGKSIPEAKHSFYQSRRVPWNQASHSLTEQGLASLSVHLHPLEDRIFTPLEAAAIMTLPTDYVNPSEDIYERGKRIGLMVAPLMAKYLAESIYENVLQKYNEKSEINC
jgi:DNA (cytosine-5)-methyltransferase 1